MVANLPILDSCHFPEEENATYGEFLVEAGVPNVDPEARSCDQWLVTGLFCGCPPVDGGYDLYQEGSQPPGLSVVPFPEEDGTTS
jgi:hypothetical protein